MKFLLIKFILFLYLFPNSIRYFCHIEKYFLYYGKIKNLIKFCWWSIVFPFFLLFHLFVCVFFSFYYFVCARNSIMLCLSLMLKVDKDSIKTCWLFRELKLNPLCFVNGKKLKNIYWNFQFVFLKVKLWKNTRRRNHLHSLIVAAILGKLRGNKIQFQ